MQAWVVWVLYDVDHQTTSKKDEKWRGRKMKSETSLYKCLHFESLISTESGIIDIHNNSSYLSQSNFSGIFISQFSKITSSKKFSSSIFSNRNVRE